MRIISMVVLLLIAQLIFGAEAPTKYALLVGVTKYDHAALSSPALEFPEFDAKGVGDVFQDAGYTVELLLGKDATQAAIKKKLAHLKYTGDSNGIVVLGFFGHGLESEATKDICFCPFYTKIRAIVDSQGKSIANDNGDPLLEPDPDSLITISDILSATRVSPAGSRLLLMDCDRTQPNQARAFWDKSLVLGLPDNTAVLFACSRYQASFEHRDWGHGAFAKCLIEEFGAMMRAGQLTIGTLADRVQLKVRTLVAKKTNERGIQTPQFVSTNVFDLQMKKK